MKKRNWLPLLLLLACNNSSDKTQQKKELFEKDKQHSDTLNVQLIDTSEKHFINMRQLTFGGDNAEAYFSSDGKYLSFQSNNKKWGLSCDQIFMMDISKAAGDSNYKPNQVSTGMGRTTCSYFMPDNKSILYASTHKSNKDCPETGDLHKGGKYLWPVFNSYEIYVADEKRKIIKQLTNTLGYDAEATVSPKGDKIVFTSDRSGDLELWTMNIDGTNQKQITHELGYDGGAFFSPDGKKLVFRASRPESKEDKDEYKKLLKQGLVAPVKMEIFTCNVDGSELKQVTHLGKANWAPFYNHAGNRIIFSSNHASKKGFDFQLYMINEDGSGLEQITKSSVFNSFPMFSPDGKFLAFSSNRNGKNHATNVFIAGWID